MVSNEILDIIGIVIFVICIIAYAIGLLYKIKRPSWGERGFLNIIYGLWVKRMIDSKETINAVQTIRNLIMVMTFLSTSMLLLLGLLLQSSSIVFLSTSTEVFAQYKLMVFVAVIVFSVIMFLLSLRQIVRLSILIGIPINSINNMCKEFIITNNNKTNNKEKKCPYIDAERLINDVFLKAMNRFTFGMRAIFYGIVITLWFVNTYAFIVGTLALTIYLVIHHDVEPTPHEKLPI